MNISLNIRNFVFDQCFFYLCKQTGKYLGPRYMLWFLLLQVEEEKSATIQIKIILVLNCS